MTRFFYSGQKDGLLRRHAARWLLAKTLKGQHPKQVWRTRSGGFAHRRHPGNGSAIIRGPGKLK